MMKKLFLSLVLAAALIAGGIASFNSEGPSSANETQLPSEQMPPDQTQTDAAPQGQTEAPTESSTDEDESSSMGIGEAPNPRDRPPTLVGKGSDESTPIQAPSERKDRSTPENPSKQARDNYNAVLEGNQGSGNQSPEMSAEEYNERVDTLYRQQRSNYEKIIDGGS